MSPQSIGLGQRPPVDRRCDGCARRVTRVDLFLDGELIDTKKPNSPARFLVETTDLEAGSAHELTAHRLRHHRQHRHDDDDDQHRAGSWWRRCRPSTAQTRCGAGSRFLIAVQATDDGRVAKVEIFVDDESRRGGDRAGRAVPVRDPDDRPERRSAHAARIVARRRRQPIGSGASVRGHERYDGARDHAGQPARHVTFAPGALIPFVANGDRRGWRRHDRLPARRRAAARARPAREGSRSTRHGRPRTRRARRDDRRDRHVGQRRDTVRSRSTLEQGPPRHDGASRRETALITLGPVDQRHASSIAGATGAAEADAQVVIVTNGATQAGAHGRGDVDRRVHDADRSGGRRHAQLRRHRRRGQQSPAVSDGGARCRGADVDCRHAFERHARIDRRRRSSST